MEKENSDMVDVFLSGGSFENKGDVFCCLRDLLLLAILVLYDLGAVTVEVGNVCVCL